MPYLRKNNLLFIHIPKTGGTSLEVAMGLAGDYPRIGLEVTETRANPDTLFGGGLQHLTALEIESNYRDVTKDAVSFVAVRCPHQRAVSHFLWAHHRFAEVPSLEVLRTAFSGHVRNLVRRYANTRLFEEPDHPELDDLKVLSAMERHLIPQCSYIFAHGILRADRILSFESLPQDWRAFANSMRMRPRLLERRMRSGAKIDYLDVYTPETYYLIAQLYGADLRLHCRNLNGFRRPDPLGPDGDVDTPLRSTARWSPAANKKNPPGSPDPPRPAAKRGAAYPKIIWQLWLQGWAQCPRLQQVCSERLADLNPDFKVIRLDGENTKTFLPNVLLDARIPPAAQSDIIRCEILHQYGGVWVDASVFPMYPFARWLDGYMTSGFFAFSKPGRNREIATWLLASVPGHDMVKKWNERTAEFWTARLRESQEPGEGMRAPQEPWYFWSHRLFGELIKDDQSFAESWSEVPKLSAHGPHYVQHKTNKLATGNLIDSAPEKSNFHHYPLFKLDSRADSLFSDELISLLDQVLASVEQPIP